MSTAKAKPCPFCASDDSFVECMDFGSFAVICNNCLAHGPTADGDRLTAKAAKDQALYG